MAFVPWYRISISLASSAEPADTESNEPIPSLAICFSLKTLVEIFRFFEARSMAC